VSGQDQPPNIPVAPGALPQPPPGPAPVIIKKVHPLSIVAAAGGGLALLISICTFAAAAGRSATPDASPSVVYVTVPGAAGPAVVATTPAQPTTPQPPPPPPPPAAPTIEDGTWTVGGDFPPGTYRTAEAVGSTCYWAITKSGTNGNEIISNDIPGGGKPTVTLKAGQDFSSQRCGTWVKVG